MKKIAISSIIILISLAPLFRGLFFILESYLFIAAFSILIIVYLLSKLILNETIFFSKWILIPGAVLIFSYSLSFIAAVNINEHIYTLMQYIVYLFIALVIFDYFCSDKIRTYVLIVLPIMISGFVCAIIGLGLLTGSFQIFRYTLSTNRLGSTFQYANTAAIFFTVCIIFTLTIINTYSNIFYKSMLVGVGNVLVFAFFMTGSRGGYLVGIVTMIFYILVQPFRQKAESTVAFFAMALPIFIAMKGFTNSIAVQDSKLGAIWLFVSFIISVIIGMAVFLVLDMFYKSRNRLVRIAISFFSLVLLITPFIFFSNRLESVLPKNIISRIINFDLNNKSITARLEFYGDAIDLIRSNWLLGLGGGGWTSMYQSVQERFYTARDVHNNYLQVFVEAGILGFLSYLALIVFSIISPMISFFKVKDEKQRLYISGVFCGFISLVLHSMMDFDLSYTSIGLLFWMLIALSISWMKSGVGEIIITKRQRILSYQRLTMLFLNVLCSLLFSISGLNATAEYYATKGINHVNSKNYTTAIAYYEEAGRLVPTNPVYQFEIAKLYNYFAPRAKEPHQADQYRKKALIAAEKSVSLDQYYPAYTEVLVYTYLDNGMPMDAVLCAERLVELQPCNIKVYELLARSYIEASEFYISENEPEQAKIYLNKCIGIDPGNVVDRSRKLSQYKEKALEVLSRLP